MGYETGVEGQWGGEYSAHAGRIWVWLLACPNAAVLVLVFRYAAYPYPIEPGDGGMLSSAWHVVTRGAIYNEVVDPPYVFNIHPPLFIHLSALAMWAFGPHPAGPRLLAEAMLLGAAVLVFLSARRLGAKTTGALIAALFVPVERYVVKRTGLAMCDQSALFLSMLGLYLWLSGGRKRYWAAAVFALAYFSKQSAVFMPLAVFAGAALEGRRREALGFGVLWAAGIGAGFLVAQGIWGKAFFLNTFFYGTATSFDAWQGARVIAVFFAAYPVFAVAVAWTAAKAFRERRLAVVPLYAAGGLVLAYASGHEGASTSYLFDLTAGAALSMGVFWERFASGFDDRRGARRAALAAAFAVQSCLFAAGIFYNTGQLWSRARASGYEEVRRSLYGTPDRMVLYHTAGYETGMPGINFSTDPHRLAQMYKAGLARREGLLRVVKEGQLGGAVIPLGNDAWGLFDDELRDAVRSNYRLIGASSNEEYYIRFEVYRPE